MKKHAIEIAADTDSEPRKTKPHLFQWLICLFIAIILWLTVVNLTGISGADFLNL